MAITFRPRVGQVLECDYGNYLTDAAGGVIKNDFSAHIPPEMVKNRLVVVLNGRIPDACIVVPLSTTLDLGKTSKGWHIEIDAAAIPALRYFTQQRRWAKCDMVQQVSASRLWRTQTARGHLEVDLDRSVVEQIQRGVIKAIGGASLLIPPAQAGAVANAPQVAPVAAENAPSGVPGQEQGGA